MKRWILIAAAVSALALAGCGGDDGDDESAPATTSESQAEEAGGDVANGAEVFAATCASCHGADGQGVENLGKALYGSAFVADTSEDDLVVLVKTGRPSSDPANTTGVDMPPNGGNPSLTEEDIQDVVAHLKAQQ